MTPEIFIAKWCAAELKERSAAQEHFIDLCRLLDEPTPAEADRVPPGRGAGNSACVVPRGTITWPLAKKEKDDE